MKDIAIGKRLIGSHHKPFIIAEMSGNHNSSLAAIKAFQKAGYIGDYLTLIFSC